MLVARVSSTLTKQELLNIADRENLIILKPSIVKNIKEILLANYLAKKAFREKTNIAKKFRLEFLLWLSATRDIENALNAISFDDKEDILLISFSKKSKQRILKLLRAKELKLKLQKNANALDLERISLSRI